MSLSGLLGLAISVHDQPQNLQTPRDDPSSPTTMLVELLELHHASVEVAVGSEHEVESMSVATLISRHAGREVLTGTP